MNKKLPQEAKVFQSNLYTESRQNFSVEEKKIMQIIISQIKPTDTPNTTYVVSMRNLMGIFSEHLDEKDLKNKQKTLYSQTKRVAARMAGQVFVSENESAKKFNMRPFFGEFDYDNGTLSVEFNPKLQQLFFHLLENSRTFTSYELSEFLLLDSKYAQRIFELLKQYESARSRSIKLDELRYILGADGKAYDLFSNFRRRVLENAHERILSHTSLRYKWKIVKEGRKVVAIHFYDIHTIRQSCLHSATNIEKDMDRVSGIEKKQDIKDIKDIKDIDDIKEKRVEDKEMSDVIIEEAECEIDMGIVGEW